MTKLFLFNLHGHPEYETVDENGIVYFFEINPPDDFADTDDDDFMDFVSDIESEYGVHDFGTCGDVERLGYHSYEVEPSKAAELIEKWHIYLTTRGFEPGEIEKLSWPAYEQRRTEYEAQSI